MSYATTEYRKYCSESTKRTRRHCLFLTSVYAATNSQGPFKEGIRRGWKDSPVLTQLKASEEDHPRSPTTPPQQQQEKVLAIAGQCRRLASRVLRLSKECAGTGRSSVGAGCAQGGHWNEQPPCKVRTCAVRAPKHSGSPAEKETGYIQGHWT